MANDNQLYARVYPLNSTTALADNFGDLFRVENLAFTTGYPGGIFLDATFYIPKRISDYWQLNGVFRVQILNGLLVVYEGYIDAYDYEYGTQSQGVSVSCVGAWAFIAMGQRTSAIWCDTRIDDGTWVQNSDRLFRYERSSGLQVRPASGFDVANGNAGYFTYTPPTGQTITNLSFTYGFNEGGQTWQWFIGSTYVTPEKYYNASAGGDDTYTFASPVSQVQFGLKAAADNATDEGTDYNALIYNLCVYYETGTIDLPAVVEDTIGAYSGYINASTDYVDSMTSSLSLSGTVTAPSSFGAFDRETIADLLMRAASFGDSAQNRWAVGFLDSSYAKSVDGKPVMYCQQYPALTDYDYAVSMQDPNLLAPVTVRQNFASIANYIIVRYNDERNFVRFVGPLDDSTLRDDDSITAYGRKMYMITLDYASEAQAINIGKRYLASYKSPRWELVSPIQYIGTLRSKQGIDIPVSQVRAGQRIKLVDFFGELTTTPETGSDLIFLISSTQYNDTDQSITITAGPPPDLIWPTFIRPTPEETSRLTPDQWETETRATPRSPDNGSKRERGDKRKPGSKADKEAWERDPRKWRQGQT